MKARMAISQTFRSSRYFHTYAPMTPPAASRKRRLSRNSVSLLDGDGGTACSMRLGSFGSSRRDRI
jgi:hypothetical protein